MDENVELAKIDRIGRLHVVSGVAALVVSALPWYSTSYRGYGVNSSASLTAWDVGVAAWFPMLLLAALGVVSFLPAVNKQIRLPLSAPILGVLVGVGSAAIVLLRWLTYPSASQYADAGVSAGASFGTYLGAALGVVVAVFSYREHAKRGGTLADMTHVVVKGHVDHNAADRSPSGDQRDRWGR